MLLLGMLALVLAVVGVVVPFTGFGNTDASAAMSSALTSTLAEDTVQMTLSATVSAAGKDVHLSGTAKADLPAKAMALTLAETAAGQHVTFAMVGVGSTLYMQIPSAKLAPGKSWLSVTEPAGSSPGTAPPQGSGSLGQVANPDTFLPLLQQAGATVQTIGTSTLGGTQVNGYRVTLSAAAMQADLAKAHLPGSLRQAFAGVSFNGLSLTVYVGGGLLREIQVATTAGSGPTALSIKMTLQFTGYGQPVDVQPPPATAVEPFSQYASTAQGGLTALLPPV